MKIYNTPIKGQKTILNQKNLCSLLALNIMSSVDIVVIVIVIVIVSASAVLQIYSRADLSLSLSRSICVLFFRDFGWCSSVKFGGLCLCMFERYHYINLIICHCGFGIFKK